MKAALQRSFSLQRTTGIVTGGSSGLGLAIARRLADAGARVHSFSRTGKPKNGRRSANVIDHAVDVTDRISMSETVHSIARSGRLDFVVHAAGITVRAPFAEGTTEDWQRIQNVNVTAAAELSRIVYPLLKKSPHPGRLLFITSMAAHLGFSEVAPYCASKGAVLGLMRGLAVEWAADGILVNSIAPGWFPTAMTQQVMDPERRQKIIGRMPLHRFGRADELTGLAHFLLSPAATYITGQDFAVDGGALAFGY